MTVENLIKILKNIDKDKIVVISDGEGWCNIEKVKVKVSTVEIIEERDPIFNN